MKNQTLYRKKYIINNANKENYNNSNIPNEKNSKTSYSEIELSSCNLI